MGTNQFQGSYGSLEVPILDNQLTDGFAGEPGLRIMAQYFQTYVNHYAAKGYESVAWDTVADEGGLIRYIFSHNPRERGEGNFRGTQTPALYVYRLGSKDIYDMAEDEHVMVSDIMCLYVHSADSPEQLSIRYPFTGAVAKLVDTAIERRRDPCFILNEDTDARKQWRGTHVWRAAGFDKVQLKEFRRSEMEVTDAESDGSWRYMAMDIVVEVTERIKYTENSDEFDTVMGVDLHVSEDIPADNVVVFPEYLRRIL